MSKLPKKPQIEDFEILELEEQTLEAMKEVALAVYKVHVRLLSEGYQLIDGQMIKVDEAKKNERTSKK